MKATGDVLTTAVRRMEAHRAHRHRNVYIAPVVPVGTMDQTPAELDVTGRRGRFAEIPRHVPYSPLAGTVLRPLGDAATTMAILLRHR